MTIPGKEPVEKILIVDDSKSVRSFLSHLLSVAGYKIFTSEDGRQGWDTAQNEKIDLIISDLEMPELDGFEFCKLVKEHPEYKNIYFILLSTKESASFKVRGLKIGADDYMGKSISNSELLARVEAGLRIRKLERELEEKRVTIFQQEKLASIGQFAGGIAHEINNPIAFISSNIVTLDEYIKKLSECIFAISHKIAPEYLDEIEKIKDDLDIDFISEDVAELIQDSLDGTKRISHITQTLRESARAAQSDCIATDINECIDDAIAVVSREFESKATINKEYTSLPLTKGYLLQLQQVFRHFLINAYQAIDGKGKIDIQTCSKNGNIYISISDSGVGIPAKYLNRIFEPFFTTKEVGTAMGLGLSSAYDIVRNNHKGNISVQSNPGTDTTFTICIPIKT